MCTSVKFGATTYVRWVNIFLKLFFIIYFCYLLFLVINCIIKLDILINLMVWYLKNNN